MQVYMCVGARRDAMGDNFKGMVNELKEKNKIIVIAPSAYQKSEFSNEFRLVIIEKMYSTKNILLRLKEQMDLYKILISICGERISGFFFMNPDVSLCYFIKKMSTIVKMTMWLHDPVMHEGSSYREYIKIKMFNYFIMKKMSNIILSYREHYDDVQKNNPNVNVSVINLPEMKEQEFEDIRGKEIEEEYDYIFFGRIEKYKGIDILIDAFLDNNLKNRKLVIVGTGSLSKHIKSRITGSENIVFINKYVENRELAYLIKKSKYVILPYISATGTQTVQLANYYGKMVIASYVGCFKEYIQAGCNGYFLYSTTKEEIQKTIKEIESNDNNSKEKINKSFQRFKLDNIVREIEKTVGGD